MNRLAQEKSPYLKQHADNPVDWYPWGEEAFKKARTEDKPIFLSIGYSTCHWCHVMAHESFENPGIAKVLNEFFVSIKVDREERPDIDAVYMKAVMALTGQGGWPLSAFLLPDLKPFYGGTYFPPEDKWGRPGFITVLKSLHQKWMQEREMITNAGQQLFDVLNETLEREASPAIETQKWMDQAYERMLQTFDSEGGGFGGAPKFPRTHALDFLMNRYRRKVDESTLEMVEKTLRAMAAGGIQDSLGGGFHRYSVDAYWHVPHFEKMLYDQALIAKSYLEAFNATQNPFYADITRSIFNYVLRDLTSPEGGFYSAEDADSLEPKVQGQEQEKREGAFYVWSETEIRAELTPEEADLFCWAYGVQAGGNVRQDPHAEFTGLNVLFRAYTADDLAARFQKSAETCERILFSASHKLLAARNNRPRPHRDEKILTDWNALMIETLAWGGRILKEPRWIDAAEKAAQFLIQELKRADGRWLHRYAEGEAAIPAFLEDYAFLAKALFELYQANFKIEYLQEAYFLCEEMNRLFYDNAVGGFFLAANILTSESSAQPVTVSSASGSLTQLETGEQLIARTKELYDGAIPSGNGAAILILVQMGRLFWKSEWIQAAEKTIQSFQPFLERDASAFPVSLLGLDAMTAPLREIYISGQANQSETQAMLAFSKDFSKDGVWILDDTRSTSDWLGEKFASAKERRAPDGKTIAYVCQNQTCSQPVFNAQALKALL